MNFPLLPQKTVWAFLSAAIVLPATEPFTLAARANPNLLYSDILTYSTEISSVGGPPNTAQIYYPNGADDLPTALLLQGALVDQADYSNFAEIVASYGFNVVVPNNVRTLTDPTTGASFPGLFPQQEQIQATLDFIASENSNPSSPLTGLLDPSQLVLLGHSFGGAVGLAALWGECVPILCVSSYDRPSELLGGAFYGTTFADPRIGGAIPAIDNGPLPVALIAGDLDSVALLEDVEATFAQLQDPPKTLVTVAGANHYGITNADNPVRDPSTPTLDQAVATETIARWSALFLRGTALGDEAALQYVFETGDDSDPNVSVISERQPIPEPGFVLGLAGVGVASLLSVRRQQRA